MDRTHVESRYPGAIRPQAWLARHRSFSTAERWLTVLLVGWIFAVVGPAGSSKIAAWALVAVSFVKLYATLPFPRRAQVALSWCVTMSVASALYELASPTLDHLGIAAQVGFSVLGVLLFAASVYAFATVMRALARLAGSPASVEQWTSVERWQLGATVAVPLIVVAMIPFGTRTGPTTFVHDSPLASAVGVLLVLGIPTLAIIYPAVAMRRLQLHLRERFDPFRMVERGELVLRDELEVATARRPAAAASPPPTAAAP